jgi:uncharacterized membrane protein YhhN
VVTTAAWVLLAVAAAFAIGNWIAVATGRKPLEYVCKPATLALLIAVALVLDPVHGDTRAWFVVALVFSLAGDVFLMIPRHLFVFGLSAFLVGHLAYIVGLNLHTDGNWLWAIPVVVVVAFLGVHLVRGIRRGDTPALAGPVVAYVLVIAAMGCSAVASGNAVAAAGALLFMLSDSLIGETRFVRPWVGAGVAIMVTYHVGQALLVVSLTT